jgi:ATP-binding cassette subfamily C (CFTR/MRP) protein 1
VLKEEPAPAKRTVDNDTARHNAVADIHRAVGNWAIYNYYLTSAGRRNVAIWASLMIFYSMTLRFPGKVIPNAV